MDDTCAFLGCDAVVSCCLVGGCVRARFGPAPTRIARTMREAEGLKDSAPVLIRPHQTHAPMTEWGCRAFNAAHKSSPRWSRKWPACGKAGKA